MPIDSETKAAIIEDLREDRLTYPEIAAKRLGDAKKKITITRIAAEAGLSRKDRMGKSRRRYNPQGSSQKSTTRKPVKIESFDEKARLSLIDEALSHLKANLPQVTHPKGFSDWTAALDRLLTQRREEEPKGSQAESNLLTKFVSDLDNHANAVLAKAGRSLQPPSGDSSEPPIRISEERQD